MVINIFYATNKSSVRIWKFILDTGDFILKEKRNWDILIIGGASGSGKTNISIPLARHYGIDLVRVDDFQVLLKALTTHETLPVDIVLILPIRIIRNMEQKNP